MNEKHHHTIINGDCSQVLKYLPANSVDLIITSPPYSDQRKTSYGGVKPDVYVDWFMPIAHELYRVLKPQGSFILNIKERINQGERHPYVLNLILEMRQQGWLWTEEYIWHKKNSYPGKWLNRFRDAWERCLHFTKQKQFCMYQENVMVPTGHWTKARLKRLNPADSHRFPSKTGSPFCRNLSNWVDRDFVYPTNVLSLATECGNTGHSAAFPVALPEWFIQLFTKPGDLVLDPFMGSGSTAIACLKQDRASIGIELNSTYVKLAQERILSYAFCFLFAFVSPCLSSDENYAQQKQQESNNLLKQYKASDVTGYVTDAPPETRLNNHYTLDAEARGGFSKNEASSALLDSANKRPYFALEPLKDPIATNSKAAMNDPKKFLSQQSFQNRAEPDFVMKTCTESKPERKYTCSKMLSDPHVRIQPAHYVPQGLSNRWWCGRGNHGDNDSKCGSRVYYPLPDKYVPEKITITPEAWRSTCQSLEDKASREICKVVKTDCLSSGTHYVVASVGSNGAVQSYPITKGCWHYIYEYECISPQCHSLRQSHCEQMESKCSQKEGAKCIAWDQTFRCPNKAKNQKQTLHVDGQGQHIPEGNERLYYEPNGEMNEAISKLYILKEVQDDLALHRAENDANRNIRQIFKGSHDKCRIAFGKFSDCCKAGKGWGHSIKLARCNGDEKILAQKREKGLCVEIGKFCSKRKAGICLQKKRSFCCFPSKFALVLHKQGRRQFGIGWGSPKDANCRGFTINELSRLDFNAMDLSEFYAELMAKMKHHGAGIVQRNLRHRVGQIASSLKNPPRREGY